MRLHASRFYRSVTDQLILELAPRPEPTFDNFVVGRNARILTALRAAACGLRRDSVYLWGEPGSGRSHLLQATLGMARAAGREDAIVAIDDVELLDPARQVEAFDAYNAVQARGLAFVAAGNAAPREVAVREDLRTRLGAGLVFELAPLRDEEKREALREHARARGLTFGDDVLTYLLTRLPRDLGTQIAVLDALDRYSLAHKRAVTLPFVREGLAALDLL
jgi:DnaA family protein